VGAISGLALGVLEFGTACAGLFIAWDMSRSMMMIAPMFMLAMWLWEESFLGEAPSTLPQAAPQEPATDVTARGRLRALGRWMLPAVLFANLCLPAYHVMWSKSWPINPFYIEFGRWRRPPNAFQAVQHLHEARRLKDAGRGAEALEQFDEALRLEANYALALIERAVLRMQLGDLAGAESDASEAVRLRPDYPFAFLLRGALRQARGDRDGAAADLRQALEIAPPNWEFHDEATRRLGELTP
jgi:tetratricopeptide (TPR) repeat protein